MWRITFFALVALVGFPITAAASNPQFSAGPLVARKMEAHYNGATYKAKLAASGARLTSRVLCAHDATLRLVECNGNASIRDAVGKRYAVSAQWELRKLSTRRARLNWTLSGGGVSRSDHEIVAPGAFGLKRF